MPQLGLGSELPGLTGLFRERAFTILEFVIVTAIILTLATMTVRTARKALDRARSAAVAGNDHTDRTNHHLTPVPMPGPEVTGNLTQ